MFNKKIGFSLAEALMALLIVALIASAMIPVLTRKHRDAGKHGRWECTLNSNGNHVVRTVLSGKDSGFKEVGESCTFTPPANVENFAVKVIGGGGSGAGGLRGDAATQEVAAINEAKNFTAPFTGDFSVMLQSGGGGGGGRACGLARKNLPVLTFESNKGVYPNPGWYDEATNTVDYSELYSNDKTKYSKYTAVKRDYCFAENTWTDETKDDDKCWNYPGQGGGAGGYFSTRVHLNKDQQLVLNPGLGGLPGAEGGAGRSGGESCYLKNGIKTCATKGAGGFNRHLTGVKYNVDVCYIKEYNSVCTGKRPVGCEKPIYSNCSSTTQAGCPSHCSWSGTACSSPTHWVENGCEEEYTYGCLKPKPCEIQARTNYFNVTACINDGGGGPIASGMKADTPQDINSKTEGDEVVGGIGSGGRGAGRITIDEETENMGSVDTSNPPSFYSGEAGQGGSATIRYVTYAAGTGGEAGGYVYSLYKKLPVVKDIKIGQGGYTAIENTDGNAGGETMFGTLLKTAGGRGGRKMGIVPDIAAGETKAIGGDGATSPLDSGVLKDFIIALGGYSGLNSGIDGYGVSTYVWKFYRDDPNAGKISKFVGGSKFQYTYGAGGGGGGGGVGVFGHGGPGAPGAVIIEW